MDSMSGLAALLAGASILWALHASMVWRAWENHARSDKLGRRLLLQTLVGAVAIIVPILGILALRYDYDELALHALTGSIVATLAFVVLVVWQYVGLLSHVFEYDAD